MTASVVIVSLRTSLPMACSTILSVQPLAVRGLGLIDVIRHRKLRRREIPHPSFDPSDAPPVDGHWRHAGAECGAQIAFSNRVVVAVTMQVHAVASALLPDRWRIRRPVQCRTIDVLGPHRKVELDGLVRVEGVDAPRSPRFLPRDEVETFAELQKGAFHPRKDDV